MVIGSIAILELSTAAYDEIERKLLEAGYDHLFARGPGTGIDMSGIEVQRETSHEVPHHGPNWPFNARVQRG